MNKKSKKGIIIIAMLVVLTNLGTFFLATNVDLIFGNRMLISAENQQTKDGILKLMELKKQIDAEYFKEVEDSVLMEGAITGMFESLGDPYTAYFTPEEFDRYMEVASGVYEGIGVVVTEDDNKATYVIAPQKGTPADLAGIRSGDRIIKVDGEDISIAGVDEVVRRVKGPAETKVDVTVSRGEQVLDFNLVRASIIAQTVESRVIDGQGYLQVSEFSNSTAEDFNNQLNGLLDQGISGLVLDLRSNPGGGVQEAVNVADRLLGETLVVYTEDKNGKRIEYQSDGKEELNLPMVVLVDGATASSSEILAGAIQDTGAGTLVGTTTFGKGVVQEIKGLSGVGGFKITMAEYFTPKGRNIHGVGLQPDVVIEATDYMYNNAFTDDEDVQLQKGLDLLGEKIGEKK